MCNKQHSTDTEGRVSTSWLDFHTSLFCCPADNYGRLRTLRQVLFSDFAVVHKWYFKLYNPERWVSDYSSDLDTITDIRRGVSDDEKGLLKQTLQCYTPSGCFKSKKKGQVEAIHNNPILQLDFDELDNFDITEVKRLIFSLPYVGYVGLSVSARLFALLLIAEPDKLEQYAEQCFTFFHHYGLTPDTTKGRNYTDLRFVSYDCNALVREDPQPLKITRFHSIPTTEATPQTPYTGPVSKDGLIRWAIKTVQHAHHPNRFKTVNRVCRTLGGYNTGLDEVIQAIKAAPHYSDVKDRYIQQAKDAFLYGKQTPILK